MLIAPLFLLYTQQLSPSPTIIASERVFRAQAAAIVKANESVSEGETFDLDQFCKEQKLTKIDTKAGLVLIELSNFRSPDQEMMKFAAEYVLKRRKSTLTESEMNSDELRNALIHFSPSDRDLLLQAETANFNIERIAEVTVQSADGTLYKISVPASTGKNRAGNYLSSEARKSGQLSADQKKKREDALKDLNFEGIRIKYGRGVNPEQKAYLMSATMKEVEKLLNDEKSQLESQFQLFSDWKDFGQDSILLDGVLPQSYGDLDEVLQSGFRLPVTSRESFLNSNAFWAGAKFISVEQKFSLSVSLLTSKETTIVEGKERAVGHGKLITSRPR